MTYTVRTLLLLAILSLVAPLVSRADTLLDKRQEYGPDPENDKATFTFDSPGNTVQLGYQAMGNLNQGTVYFRAAGANGFGLFEASLSPSSKAAAGTFTAPAGSVEISMDAEDCAGQWHLVVVEIPPERTYYALLASGPLMVLVALIFVIGWERKTAIRLRWFWVGAGIWAVGVALKILWAVALNEPILGLLKSALPHDLYIAAGSIYIGLLTGIFEIGITLAFAWKWRQMTRTGDRAVAVGIGAGAFEAILLGFVAGTQVVVSLAGVPGTDLTKVMTAYLGASTSVLWLIGPVERVLAILCHTSARVLVLLGVAQRRWAFFWYGFLIMTVVDTIAGWIHLSGSMGRISMWWIELAIAPVAVAGIPIIRWCLRNWPAPPEAPPESDYELAPGS